MQKAETLIRYNLPNKQLTRVSQYPIETYTKSNKLWESLSGDTYYMYEVANKGVGTRKYLINKSHATRKKELGYLSVGPGAGKTNWAISVIIANTKENKDLIIYCAPTILLLKQTFKRVLEKTKDKSKLKIIYHSASQEEYAAYTSELNYMPTPVQAEQIVANMKKGECLFLTHETLYRTSQKNMKNVALIFDETSDLKIEDEKFTLDTRSVSILHQICSFEIFPKKEFENTRIEKIDGYNFSDMFEPYMRLRLDRNSHKTLEQYSGAAEVAKNSKLASLLHKAANDGFAIYLKDEAQIGHRLKNYSEKGRSNFLFLDFETPELFFANFKRVMFLAAFFEKSAMFQLLNNNYTLKDYNHLVCKETLNKITEGYNNLEIIPLFNTNRTLSKNILNNTVYVPEKERVIYLELIKKYAKYMEKISPYTLREVESQLASYLATTSKREHGSYIVKTLSKISLNKEDMQKVERLSQRIVLTGTKLQKLILEELKRKKEKENFVQEGLPLVLANLSKDSANLKTMLPLHESFEWLRSKSHGLNSYLDRNVFISLASYTPPPTISGFYNFLFRDSNVGVDLHIYTILQGLTRTKLRLPDNKEKVIMFVFSTKEALQIKAILKQAVIKTLDSDKGSLYYGTQQVFKREFRKVISSDQELNNNYETLHESVEDKKTRQGALSKTRNAEYRADKKYNSLMAEYAKINRSLKKVIGTEKQKLEKEKIEILEKLKKRREKLKNK